MKHDVRFESAHLIVHDNMGYKQVHKRWVPEELSEEHHWSSKKHVCDIYTDVEMKETNFLRE
jgi:hypothetical protein